MNLVYGSVCSGIEAATVAWEPLGWSAKFFSEIEKFPSAVLAHHYGSNMPGEPLSKNGIPNYGDFTTIPTDAGPVDVLVGGTPCQSFSVAGRRLGLDDPRGNLALEYLALARRLRARWIVWENVPGVLSSVSDEKESEDGVRSGVGSRQAGDEWIEESDFATFLSFVQECGYGFAYRILDAQYVRVHGFERAVPQRRRRVFVVGYLGDWRRAAAVLLEPAGMLRNPSPSRKQGQRPSPTISARTSGGGGLGTDFELDGGLVSKPAAFGGGNTSDEPRGVSAALTAKGQRIDFEVETFIVSGHGDYRSSETPTLRASGGDVQGGSEGLVAHSLRGEGFDASEDGTGRGTPIVPVYTVTQDSTPVSCDNFSPALKIGTGLDMGQPPCVAYAIQERAVSENPSNGPQGKGYQEDVAYTLEARNKTQGVVHSLSAPDVADTITVGANQTTGFTGDDIACRDAYSIDMRNASRDPDKKDAVNRQGVGIGDDCAHTVSVAHVNAVAYPVQEHGVAVFDPNQITSKTNRSVPQEGICHTLPGTPNAPIAFSVRGRDGGAQAEVEPGGIAPALRTDGGGSSKTFVAFSSKDYGADADSEVSPTLRAGTHDESHANAGVPPAVAFDWYASESQSFPVNEGYSPPLKTTMQPAVQNGWAVRRLTPRECERLQGFPDDYTQIPNWDGWRDVGADEDVEELKAAGLTIRLGKNGFRVNDPDGVRYKSLGNSMAVNVMRWIGWRIDHFEKLVSEGKIPR